jgi:predicted RNA-binding protein with TRAM domain
MNMSRAILLLAAGALTATASAQTMYATNNLSGTNGYTNGGDELIMFDASDPAGWVQIGEIIDGSGSVDGLGGLDFDSDGNLWAANSFGNNPGGIYLVDPTDASAVLVGNAPANMSDLAWNPVLNDLYGTDAAGNLWANVDVPGDATLVGNYGIGSLEVGIAFDSAGNLYMHDLVNDAIYVGPAGDLTNVSVLYDLPFDSNFSQGLFVDWSGGEDVGYHGALNNSALTTEIWPFAVSGSGYGPILSTFPTHSNGLPEVELGDLTMMPVDDCGADYNGDGVVNSQDFVAFLNDFVAGEPGADYNGDGVINSQDFVAFLNDFVAGC